jgi:hypothetical protein
VTAHGYYQDESDVRLAYGKTAVITLQYRPPDGTFVSYVSGSNGLDWQQATVSGSTARATEFDWVCPPAAHAGKEVGHWSTFVVDPPAAVAPDVIGPGWVRRAYPLTNPPPPPSGCGPPKQTIIVSTLPAWLR